MTNNVDLDQITTLDMEELKKVDLYSQIKHRVEQENHWQLQKIILILSAIVAVASLVVSAFK